MIARQRQAPAVDVTLLAGLGVRLIEARSLDVTAQVAATARGQPVAGSAKLHTGAARVELGIDEVVADVKGNTVAGKGRETGPVTASQHGNRIHVDFASCSLDSLTYKAAPTK